LFYALSSSLLEITEIGFGAFVDQNNLSYKYKYLLKAQQLKRVHFKLIVQFLTAK